MKKVFIFAVFASLMLASCNAESNNVVTDNDSIEVVDTFTTEQRNAIDYCYNEIWEWDYLYNSLPLQYNVKTGDRYGKLKVLVWLHNNNDEWGDTIEESDAWEIICNQVLHIEY